MESTESTRSDPMVSATATEANDAQEPALAAKRPNSLCDQSGTTIRDTDAAVDRQHGVLHTQLPCRSHESHDGLGQELLEQSTSFRVALSAMVPREGDVSGSQGE